MRSRSFIAFLIVFVSTSSVCISQKSPEDFDKKESFGKERAKFEELMSWFDYFIKPAARKLHILLPDSLKFENPEKMFYLEHEFIMAYADRGVDITHVARQLREEKKRDILSRLHSFDLTNTTQSLDDAIGVYYPFSLNTILQKNINYASVMLEAERYIDKVGNSVDTLLFSKRYTSSNLKVPSSLQDYFTKVVNSSKTQLKKRNEVFFSRVKDFKVSLEERTGSPLWFSSNYSDSTIYVSPKILRAVFILTFNQHYSSLRLSKLTKRGKNYISYDLFGGMRTMNHDDYWLSNKVFRDLFTTEISLMLHHELAHVYLGTLTAPEHNEMKCDCYALAFYRKSFVIGGGGSFGIFESLLKSSIENDSGWVWDVDDPTDLKNRFESLESIRDQNIDEHYCKVNF